MAREAKERSQYFIVYYGEVFEVSRELYLYHYGEKRKIKYERERQKQLGFETVSLEHYLEMGFSLSDDVVYNGNYYCKSVEDQVVNEIMIQKLRGCLKELSLDEQKLIYAIYYAEESERSYARRMGWVHETVRRRKDKILKKLKKMLINESH